MDAVEVARRFHETYNRLAPRYGWPTNGRPTAVSWDELPDPNRRLMVATAIELLEWLEEEW